MITASESFRMNFIYFYLIFTICVSGGFITTEHTEDTEKENAIDHSTVIVTLITSFVFGYVNASFTSPTFPFSALPVFGIFWPRRLFVADARSLIHFGTCIPEDKALVISPVSGLPLASNRSIACFCE